jgi:DNA polymerase-3 subunit alpha/error-prone DNA polymerase
MKFVSFEDTTGIYETVFIPKEYNQFCHMLNEMGPYVLKGTVEKDFAAVTLAVDRIKFLDRYKREKLAFSMQGGKMIGTLF